MIRSPVRGLAALALALTLPLSLGGCISLFPKQDPAQLYSFGTTMPPADATQGPRFSVLNQPLGFDRIAATDRILTITGNQVAYIKGARWAAPAPLMFLSAEQRAFDAVGGRARLIGPGDGGRPDALLKVDVMRFEARYNQGAGAAPTVVVRIHATLIRNNDHAIAGEQVFESSTPASDNRVGPISEAFDGATSQVLGQLVSWVERAGG